MRKNFFKAYIALCACALLASCSSNDDDDQLPEPSPTNPYYFNFKSNGTAYNFNSPYPSYMSFFDDQIGGYQSTSLLTYPSISLAFQFDGHKPTETEVLSLAGNTYHFDGTYPKPVVEFDGGNTTGSEQYTSKDTSADYNVTINSISYVRTDTTVFNVVDVYRVKGTCKAYLEPYQPDYSSSPFLKITDGDFDFLISRVK